MAKSGGRGWRGGGAAWPLTDRSEGLPREPRPQALQSGTGSDAQEVRLPEPYVHGVDGKNKQTGGYDFVSEGGDFEIYVQLHITKHGQ